MNRVYGEHESGPRKGSHPVIGQVFHRHVVATGPANDVLRYNRYVCGVLGAIAQAIDDRRLVLAGWKRFLAMQQGADSIVEVDL